MTSFHGHKGIFKTDACGDLLFRKRGLGRHISEKYSIWSRAGYNARDTNVDVHLVANVREDTPKVKETISIIFQRIVTVESYQLSAIF